MRLPVKQESSMTPAGSIPAFGAHSRDGINKCMKIFYYLYQVTNTLNGKIYVGVHKTKDINDGYMGSGKVINRAIEKYGIENFTKVILEQFEDPAAMYAREKEVVTDEFLLREDTYNLRRGGFGGFDYINKVGENVYGNNGKPGFGGENLSYGGNRIRSSEENLRMSIIKKRQYDTGLVISSFKTNNPMRSNEGRAAHKAALAKIGHSQGIKNSQFGSRWITNEVTNKKIKKDDPVPNGWRAGRKVSIIVG